MREHVDLNANPVDVELFDNGVLCLWFLSIHARTDSASATSSERKRTNNDRDAVLIHEERTARVPLARIIPFDSTGTKHAGRDPADSHPLREAHWTCSYLLRRFGLVTSGADCKPKKQFGLTTRSARKLLHYSCNWGVEDIA